MKYITVKQLYDKLNAEHPGLIGINAVYDLVKRKDFPSVRTGRKFLIIGIKGQLANQGCEIIKAIFSDFHAHRSL